MKKVLFSFLIIAMMGFMARAGLAVPVNVGDVIYKTGSGEVGGGEFTVYDETTGAIFKTFCLEHNETINSWQDVVINSISNAAGEAVSVAAAPIP